MSKMRKGKDQPPQISPAFHGTKTLRFYSASTASGAITVKDLLDLIFVASSATAGYRLLDSIRLRKIEIWASAPAAGTTVVSVEESVVNTSSLISGRSFAVTDMVVGSARSAHVVYKPTRGSYTDMWFSAGLGALSTSLINIIAPASSVLDLTLDYVIADGLQAPTSVSRGVAGAVTGQVYCSAFGYSISPTLWVPVGLANI